jgi:hypothetical protein
MPLHRSGAVVRVEMLVVVIARVMPDRALVRLVVVVVVVALVCTRVVVGEADDWNEAHLTLLSFLFALLVPRIPVLGTTAAGSGDGDGVGFGGKKGSTANCSHRRVDWAPPW